MPTKSPRINIVCESEVFDSINKIAKKQRKSLSTIAHQLLLNALEREEDFYFSKLAKKRAAIPSKHLPHDEVWN